MIIMIIYRENFDLHWKKKCIFFKEKTAYVRFTMISSKQNFGSQNIKTYHTSTYSSWWLSMCCTSSEYWNAWAAAMTSRMRGKTLRSICVKPFVLSENTWKLHVISCKTRRKNLETDSKNSLKTRHPLQKIRNLHNKCLHFPKNHLFYQQWLSFWSYLSSLQRFPRKSSQTTGLWSQFAACTFIYPLLRGLLGPRVTQSNLFLTKSQDSWQITFFLLTRTGITSNLLIQLQERTPGFSRNKAAWWNQQNLLLLLCWNH